MPKKKKTVKRIVFEKSTFYMKSRRGRLGIRKAPLPSGWRSSSRWNRITNKVTQYLLVYNVHELVTPRSDCLWLGRCFMVLWYSSSFLLSAQSVIILLRASRSGPLIDLYLDHLLLRRGLTTRESNPFIHTLRTSLVEPMDVMYCNILCITELFRSRISQISAATKWGIWGCT